MSPDTPDLTALLRTQHAVAGVLDRDAPREEVVDGLLAAIGESLGWTAGALWEATAGGGLEPTAGRPVGNVAVQDLAAEALRSAAPRLAEGAVCFPLLGSTGAVGVLAFRAQADPSPELIETLETLGRHIGRHLERSAADAESRRNDAFMRATLNAAFEAIVTMDAEGTIIGVNPAAEELFGRSEAELVGRELAAAIVPPSLREAHRRGVREYIARGSRRMVGHPTELTALRADGTEFPVEVAIRRLELPGPPVFTGFIRDLTAQRAAEAEVRMLASEQAALRRVATLVARGAEHATVFSAVTQEVARLFGAQTANMIRYEGDDRALVIGAWSEGDAPNVPVGATVPLDGDSAGPRIRRTGAPVRVDAFEPGHGRLADSLRQLHFNAAIGAPVVLEGSLWGAVIVRSASGPFPAGAEYRLQAFAELAAQALANAEAREELAASRARLVTAGMAERRRLERNLHDGAQQRLVSLALMLRLATRHVGEAPERARRELELAGEELARALSELREIARGLHPAILADHGLEAGIASIAGRAPVPVDVEVELPGQPAEAVQAAAYYVVAEALTNVAKYAHASSARVSLRGEDGRISVEVADDGVGGADRRRGSGLRGLTDRVEALGGRLEIHSPPGRGTRIHAELPA
jgi:PAS domain S-box-containing protein